MYRTNARAVTERMDESVSMWNAEKITQLDAAHVWHPYASRHQASDNIPVRSAQGQFLHLADGRRVIDGMSSWWAASHGHSHPNLIDAATKQISTMSHVMFGGLTHQPAVELAERLVLYANDFSRSPTSNHGQDNQPLDSVFFSDSGSVAVEVALKMAIQYQRGAGHPERYKFLTWRGGYHGDTRATMALSDPDTGMHSIWSATLPSHIFIPSPPAQGASHEEIEKYLGQCQSTIRAHNGQSPKKLASEGGIAGIIVEPIVQGAGGMRFHDPALITGLRRICSEEGILLILDEIATGFGRTGEHLASHAAGILPDILCLGKALTGGFMSFAATLSTAQVAERIDSPAGGGALMHGPTFMGNPLACSVALAALDLTESEYWREAVSGMQRQLFEELAPLAGKSCVKNVRTLGAIGVVEMNSPIPMASATQTLIEHGVWLRPFGSLLYAMPPFISTHSDISAITAGMRAVVDKIESQEQ